MEAIFSDWQAKNISVVLHEKKGGYAENMPSMRGLRAKSEDLGVELHAPVSVTGIPDRRTERRRRGRDRPGGDRLRAGRGRGRPLGPRLLAHARPARVVDVKGRDGNVYERPMWTYWCLQEGTLGVDPSYLLDNEGNMPPVVHVDTDAPLIDDMDGSS